jgi:cytochrome c oxidase subunit II
MIRALASLPLVIFLAGCDRVPKAEAAASRSENSLAPAPDPALIDRGRQVFLMRTCVMCHTVRGTVAQATVGPDLTHLASRRTIAAGTLPNTTGHLAGWILNPHNLKSQTRMPPTALSSEELHALLAFLQSLK